MLSPLIQAPAIHRCAVLRVATPHTVFYRDEGGEGQPTLHELEARTRGTMHELEARTRGTRGEGQPTLPIATPNDHHQDSNRSHGDTRGGKRADAGGVIGGMGMSVSQQV